MTPNEATEQAYKNGYEKGKQDAVKHGRWIEGKTLEKCSICGKKGFPDWHYCPNCGAKMDGGADHGR